MTPEADRLITNFQKDRDSSQTINSKRSINNLIQRYKINMEIVESISNHFKIKPLFVWQPVPVYKCDHEYNLFATFDYVGYVPTLSIGYREMAKVVAGGQFGDNFLYLADIQVGLNKSLYVDAIHYTPYLCRIIAQRIADKLEELKIIKEVGQNP